MREACAHIMQTKLACKKDALQLRVFVRSTEASICKHTKGGGKKKKRAFSKRAARHL